MLVYLLLAVLSLANAEVPENVCNGTNGRMAVPSNSANHYLKLKNLYTNCTYVEGNLELTWIPDKSLDLSFLTNIREVTGYVLILHVDVPKFVLPNLQVIHGKTRFKLNSFPNHEFALMISLSRSDNIEFPALRDIITGDVGLLNNLNLCHLKTINWEEIMSGVGAKYLYAYDYSVAEPECPPCDAKCEAGCWGEGVQNCQKFSKVNCSLHCHEGRCYGTEARECCHFSCAGGCTGPSRTDCFIKLQVPEVYVDGCTGPAIVNDKDDVLQCLGQGEQCPIGYYSASVPVKNSRVRAPVCRKCHPRCKKCTGYGFHEQVCQECAFFKRGEQCGIEGSCPQNFYFRETERYECFPCPDECEFCRPASSDCLTCRICQN